LSTLPCHMCNLTEKWTNCLCSYSQASTCLS